MTSTSKKSFAKIIAVSKSQTKGIKKKNIEKGLLMENYGLSGDAHGNSETHRQISLLAIESIKKMQDLGLDVGPGDFAENITTIGMDLKNLPIGTQLSTGVGILEVTQIGKECHNHCEIGRQVGDCIMPKEGIFCRVITGGKVKVGDEIRIV